MEQHCFSFGPTQTALSLLLLDISRPTASSPSPPPLLFSSSGYIRIIHLRYADFFLLLLLPPVSPFNLFGGAEWWWGGEGGRRQVGI